ncbi:nucleoside diphosphate kinase 2 [Actinidia rufa]|uniref:Nucleoside diphosphate kinase n=1 Tax=Actinidia rufa TaxID=165716 RepID=A0A7J0GAM4_9ERIC|nr:nucleoside diphosphate kinase 2 [Actinidia rufa]
MEALAVLGGSPCASPSYLFRSASHRTTSLSYTPSHLNQHRSHHNLAPFQPQSNLLSSYPSRPLAPRKNRKKPHIFLPHLEKVDKSYIMVKPDGVQRGLVGEIISRFEKKGFKLTGLKLFQCPKELAEEHYKDLKSKPFFPKLIDYITSGPVVCMAWEGVGVVASARKLIGATNPLQAEPGTIRGDLAVQTGRNVVHGSDSPENGEREIALWFKEGEICEWSPAQTPWLME